MRIVLMALLALFTQQSLSVTSQNSVGVETSPMNQAQQFTLDNGLKVLVKEDHRAPVVVTMVWYNVGSADEPGGLTGVSHALEHLMFKGTKKYPMGVFAKTIAALGGQNNAFTNNDYTAYFEKIAAEHLPISLELEADRMEGLLLEQQEFEKELKVIQEERRLRTDDNPQALTFERFLATAHLAAPYHHPVIGWMSDIKQLTLDDALAWYHRFYAPNNATLVVVGDVKADVVHQLANQYFGKLSASPQAVRKLQKEPRTLGGKAISVHAPAQVPMLMLGYTVPTVKTAAADHIDEPYALEIIASVLAAGDSGRFSQQLVRNKQVASAAEVYYNLYARYQSQFVMYGTASQNHTVKELKTQMLAEIKRLQTELIDEKELQRVKTQIIAEKIFERDSIFGQAMELGLLETVGLGWQTADKYVDRINAITAQQIQRTAIRYFYENGLTEAVLIPDNHSMHKAGGKP